MSTRTSLEGQKYYQLGIAVNPGNSGGPVFDSSGAVIGVVTRKSARQESLAFCIPVEELNLALEKVVRFPQHAIDEQDSRHRLILTVKELGGSGALYSSAINQRRQNAATGSGGGQSAGFYNDSILHLQGRTFPRLKGEVVRVRSDPLVSQSLREKVVQLADNLEKLKALYAADKPVKGGNDPLTTMKATHLRLITELCNALNLEIPINIFFALGDSSDKGKPKDAPKDHSTKPGSPKDGSAKPESPSTR